MSIYQELLDEGNFDEKEIRNAILEENDSIIGEFSDEGEFSSEEVLTALSQEAGMPEVIGGFDDTKLPNKVDLSANKYLTEKVLPNFNKEEQQEIIDSIPTAETGIPEAPKESFEDRYNSTMDFFKADNPEISEAMARANQLYDVDRISLMAKDLITDDFNQKEEAIKTAGDYLVKTGVIKDYSLDGTALMKDGSEVKLESGFLDSIAASKSELIRSIGGSTTAAIVAGATTKNPFAIINAGILGGAAGSASGSASDKLANAEFFGKALSTEDLMQGMLYAGTDDLLFGKAVASIFKYGGKAVSGAKGKVGRLYNAFVKNDLDGAFDTMVGMSRLDTEGQQKLVETAAKMWGETLEPITTDAGKQQYIKFLGMYDSSMSGYLESSAKLSMETPVKIFNMMADKTKHLKNQLSNIARPDKISNVAFNPATVITNISELDTMASKNYGAMLANYEKAFANKTINPVELTKNFGSKIDMLSGIKGQFTEQAQASIEGLKNLSENMTDIVDVVNLYKQYNQVLSNVPKSMSKEQLSILKSGKADILSFMSKNVSDLKALSGDEKKYLMKSFYDANSAVSSVKKTINTDLYDAIVSKRGNVADNEKLLDSMLDAASSTSTKGEIDETSRMLNMVDYDKLPEVEGALINRIIDRHTSTSGLANFGDVFRELKDVGHVFKSDESLGTISRLNEFSRMWDNDPALIAASSVVPVVQTSGAGLTMNVVKATAYASFSKAFAKLQVIMPAVLKELSFVGNTALKLPILKDWAKASRTKAIELNIDSAIAKSGSLPDFFNSLLENEVVPIKSKLGVSMKTILHQYAKMNDEFSKIPIAEREALAQEAKDNAIKQIPSRTKSTSRINVGDGKVKPETPLENAPAINKPKPDEYGVYIDVDPIPQKQIGNDVKVPKYNKPREIVPDEIIDAPTKKADIVDVDIIPNKQLETTKKVTGTDSPAGLNQDVAIQSRQVRKDIVEKTSNKIRNRVFRDLPDTMKDSEETKGFVLEALNNGDVLSKKKVGENIQNTKSGMSRTSETDSEYIKGQNIKSGAIQTNLSRASVNRIKAGKATDDDLYKLAEDVKELKRLDEWYSQYDDVF